MDQPTFSLEGHEMNNNEELIYLWTIPDFENRARSAVKNPDVSAKKFVKAQFHAGKKSDSAPNWELFLELRPETQSVDIGLQYFGPGSCLAKCEVYFKSLTGKLLRASTLENQEYAEGSIGTCKFGQNLDPNDPVVQEEELLLLPNGVLHMQLNVTISNRTPDAMDYKMEVLRAFKNGLDSQVGSDVIFVFEEDGSGNVIEDFEEIRAHKAIMSFHSPVFAEMFGNEAEGTPTRMKITEMSPHGMKILLQFLYSGEMDEDWTSVVEELIHATQKYQLGLMQTFLKENITSVLTPKNAWKVRNWGKMCGLLEVVAYSTQFIMWNFEEFLRFHNLTSKEDLP